MQYRKMTKEGWEVSTLGFGVMRMPVKDAWNKIDYDKAGNMLRYAIDQGVNYLDTAWMYHEGASEEFLGEFLTKEDKTKLKIASKSPIWLIESKKDFHDYFEKQRQKLKADCIHFYLLHALNAKRWEKVKRLGLLDEMMSLKAEGKIEQIGFSFHGSEQDFRDILDAFDWDMTQIQYNYLDTEFQATIRGLDYAYSKGVPVVVMEPLQGGKLAQTSDELKIVLKTAQEKRELVEWALHFILDHPGVVTILSGMSLPEHVEGNINFVNSFPGQLSESGKETISKLKQIYKKKIKVSCTSCMYCIPCPEGIHIPENLFLLNQAFWAGEAAGWIKKWYNEMESDDPSTNWHEKGSAGRCTQCGECLDKCPQGIAIPDELDIVRRILEDGVSLDQV